MADIALLKLFLAIAETGSIAGGARKMGILPSVASRNLSKLEEEFKVRLVHRSTRSLKQTDAGRLFEDRVRAIVVRYDQLADELAFEQGVLAGHIRIASNDFMGHFLLPNVLGHFRRRHPGLTFTVIMADEPIRLLGDCDLAIHAGSSPGGSLIGKPLHTYQRVICASPDYFTRYGVPNSPSDLEQHDCIVHTHNDRQVWHFQGPNGARIAQAIDPVVEANSYPAMLSFAKQGLGLIRIARVMTDRLVADGSLQIAMPEYRCVQADGTDPTIWLTYQDRELLSRVRLVADYLHELMRKLVSHPSWIVAMEQAGDAHPGDIGF